MKLDFRTKLFMTFCISTLLIAGSYRGKAVFVAFLLGLIPFLLFLIDGKLKPALVGGAVYLLIFSISEFSMVGALPMLNFIILIISGIFAKMYSGIMMGYYTLKTTKINMPDFIIIPLSVMFRFFFSISYDYKEIRKAMKLQNLGLKSLFKEPLRTLEYTVVPLAMCSVRAADDVSISAMSRGLKTGRARSSISNAKLKYYDYLLMLLMVGFVVFHIWSHYVRN